MARGQTRTNQKRLAALERQRQAVELRTRGLGFRAIADRLGYQDASGAYRAVRAAMRAAIREPAEELIALELARLDDLLAGLWEEARAGHVGKVDRVLRIMERRAALLGLDEPKRFQIAEAEVRRLVKEYDLDPEEIRAEVARIVAGTRA